MCFHLGNHDSIVTQVSLSPGSRIPTIKAVTYDPVLAAKYVVLYIIILYQLSMMPLNNPNPHL